MSQRSNTVDSAKRPTVGQKYTPRPLDNLEARYVVVLAFFVVAGLTAFLLVEVGWFRWPIPVLIGLAAGLITMVRLRRGTYPSVRNTDLLGLLVPLVLGVALYFPPDEWILGNADPGVYVNGAVVVAQTGGFILNTPLFASLPPAIRDGFLQHPASYGTPSRLPGFYDVIYEVGRGYVVVHDRTIPWGFHLFPSILAIGYGVAGLPGELATIPLLALLAIAGFYLFARRTFGVQVATIASLMLALCPAEIWFARFPDAEILVQLLVFGGLFCFVLVLDTRAPETAVVAGATLGAVHLAKIEDIPLIGIVGIYAAARVIFRQVDRNLVLFCAAYAATLALAVVQGLTVATFYTAVQLAPYIRPFANHPSITIVSCIALTVGLVALWRWQPVYGGFFASDALEFALRYALPLAIGALAVYGYYIRPLASIALLAASPATRDYEAINNLQSFVRLGWYITPLGLLLGSLGWMLIVSHERSHRTVLFLAVVAAESVFFLANGLVNPMHYWAARRWLPYTVPGFFVAAAYLICTLLPQRRDSLRAAIVPVAFTMVMLAGLLEADRPLLNYVEYRGAISQLTTLAGRLPPDSISLFPNGDAGLRLTLPLQIIFHRKALVFSNAAADSARNAANYWLGQGKTVYWITTPDLAQPSDVGLRGVVVGNQRFAVPEKLGTYDTRPGADGLFQQDLIIWRLEPTPARSQTP